MSYSESDWGVVILKTTIFIKTKLQLTRIKEPEGINDV